LIIYGEKELKPLAKITDNLIGQPMFQLLSKAQEMERLGEALMDLDTAIDEIKQEQGIAESVKSVRGGLDNIVDDVIDQPGHRASRSHEDLIRAQRPHGQHAPYSRRVNRQDCQNIFVVNNWVRCPSVIF